MKWEKVGKYPRENGRSDRLFPRAPDFRPHPRPSFLQSFVLSGFFCGQFAIARIRLLSVLHPWLRPCGLCPASGSRILNSGFDASCGLLVRPPLTDRPKTSTLLCPVKYACIFPPPTIENSPAIYGWVNPSNKPTKPRQGRQNLRLASRLADTEGIHVTGLILHRSVRILKSRLLHYAQSF